MIAISGTDIPKSRKGFTLIEILVVVAIIAILSSVVLVGLGPTRRAGRDARRIADLRQIQSGLELYFNKCGYYPGNTQNISPCAQYSTISPVTTRTSWTTSFVAALTGSGLGISNVPNDPDPSRSYQYGASAGGAGYVLGAILDDPANAALNNDVDGFINGIDCGQASADTVYCLQL